MIYAGHSGLHADKAIKQNPDQNAMESAAWAFLAPAAPRVGDLYGASGGARAGEPLAFALEMEQLEREERAFAASVQALVRRPAPEPIGVKFHRPGGVSGRFSMDTRTVRGSSVGGGAGGRGLPFPPSQFAVDESSTDSVGLHERADDGDGNEDEDEDDEEDEGEEEEDMDEDETDEDDVFTAEEDHDEEEEDEEVQIDPFERIMHEMAPEPRADDGSMPLDPGARPAARRDGPW